MSKKTLKPRRLIFLATFLYGLLFWCLVFVSLFAFLLALTAKPEHTTFFYVLVGIVIALTIGMWFLRKVRRKALSLKLLIQPENIPYSSDEVKHYLGLQEDDVFSEDYYAMCSAYRSMKKSKMVQIILSSRKNEELRSAANSYITTAETKLETKACPVLYLKQEVPVLLGCDRTAFYLYPHFIIRVHGKNDISALSYAELNLRFIEGSYILSEDEKIPRDAEVIGEAYEHTNKDGSPDMRVKDNPSTPIIKTADIESNNFGIHYQLSNYDAAEEFYSKYSKFAGEAIKAEKIKRALKEAAIQVQQGKIDLDEK